MLPSWPSPQSPPPAKSPSQCDYDSVARFKFRTFAKAFSVAHDFLYEGAPELGSHWVPSRFQVGAGHGGGGMDAAPAGSCRAEPCPAVPPPSSSSSSSCGKCWRVGETRGDHRHNHNHHHHLDLDLDHDHDQAGASPRGHHHGHQDGASRPGLPAPNGPLGMPVETSATTRMQTPPPPAPASPAPQNDNNHRYHSTVVPVTADSSRGHPYSDNRNNSQGETGEDRSTVQRRGYWPDEPQPSPPPAAAAAGTRRPRAAAAAPRPPGSPLSTVPSRGPSSTARTSRAVGIAPRSLSAQAPPPGTTSEGRGVARRRHSTGLGLGLGLDALHGTGAHGARRAPAPAVGPAVPFLSSSSLCRPEFDGGAGAGQDLDEAEELRLLLEGWDLDDSKEYLNE